VPAPLALLEGRTEDVTMVWIAVTRLRGGKLPDTSARMLDEHGFESADADLMRLALDEAERAATHGDVPIGAVVTRDGEVLASAGNERELRADPTAHAEILALRAAAERLGGWRIGEATIYVTLEPCAMCAGAIVLARVPRVVYGAADPKAGACGSVLDVLGEPRLNHRPRVDRGLLADESAALLSSFFADRR
jgi:tRNA(adenine34) deaminase